VRVIGGEFRSRRLLSLPGTDTRPTPDKLRETLFNVLGPSIARSVFIDAYAGTGAVGIEALSRGARHAVFIEKDRKAADTIRANLTALGIDARARVLRGSTALLLPGLLPADFVFLDPPYPMEREYRAALDAMESNPPRLVIAQHSIRFPLDEKYGPLHKTRTIRQSDNVLSFFRPIEKEAGEEQATD
jgi:16S rRNA (guanine(966)-N(2))-methyltransferase RsmD